MNRHKTNWSAMHDMNTEESQISKDYKELRKALRDFATVYGINEAVTIIRKIYEEENYE